MDLVASIKTALKIIQLDRAAMNEVARDENATIPGVIILAIGGAMAGLGTLLRLHPITFATIVVTSVVVSVIIIVVIHVFAGFLGGKAGFIEFFRCAAYASILGWLNVIGGLLGGGRLGALSGLGIAMANAFVLVIILETVHQLERPKSFVLPGLLLVPAVLGFFTSMAVMTGVDMLKDSKYGKMAQQIEKAAPQFQGS